jgi:hypothetical protein
MSNSHERRIIISLEISVPLDGASNAAQVRFSQEQRAKRITIPGKPGCLEPEIIHVPGIGTDVPVKMMGSGFGVICSRGDGHEDADQVKGCCYQSTPNSLPPANADSDWISSDTWQLSAVPGAVVGDNTLRVWYLRSGSVIHTEDVDFVGFAATHTFCESSAGGGFDRERTKRIYLPSQFSIRTDGFSCDLSDFNGEWILLACPQLGDAHRAIWRADGPNGASVELAGDLDHVSATLSFRQKAMEVCYRKAAGHWNPANVGDFSDISSRSLAPRAALPACVQVHPGVLP